MTVKDESKPRLTAPSKKSLTPEQAERRAIVAERTKRMSERGVPTPASNIFGGKPSTKK